TTWPAEYPNELRNAVAALPGRAGYTYRDAAGQPAGWYMRTQHNRYDFQDDPAGTGRGLVVAKLDALGGESLISHDSFAYMPAQVRRLSGAAGHELGISAAYNYRVGQPRRTLDENGNVSEFAFTPAGLPAAVWVRGKQNPAQPEGDLVEP